MYQEIGRNKRDVYANYKYMQNIFFVPPPPCDFSKTTLVNLVGTRNRHVPWRLVDIIRRTRQASIVTPPVLIANRIVRPFATVVLPLTLVDTRRRR
jgi:hypothetical protein